MILPIRTYGDEILTKKTDIVDLNDPHLPEIITNMYETMRNSTIGLGITAPQVGINKQLFIIEGEDDDNFNGVFINPKILRSVGYRHSMVEICLSFPDLELNIIRTTIIEIEWYDEKKDYHTDFFTDFQARVIQHEVDHLNGILMIDKADEDELLENSEKLKNIKNKKFNKNE